MSDENDFIMISSCNPEGQKINLDLPLLETPATMDFNTTMRNYHNYYIEHLGKKTVLVYTCVDTPTKHTIFDKVDDKHINVNVWKKCFADESGIFRFDEPNYSDLTTVLLSKGQPIRRICGYCCKTYLNDFIERMVDYKGWNVVMITHDETKKTYHIDRIFLAK